MIVLFLLYLFCTSLLHLNGAPTPNHVYELDNDTSTSSHTHVAALTATTLRRQEVHCLKNIPNKQGNLTRLNVALAFCSGSSILNSTVSSEVEDDTDYSVGQECNSEISSISVFQAPESAPCASMVHSCLQESRPTRANTTESRFQGLVACLARGHRCRANTIPTSRVGDKKMAMTASFYFSRLAYAFQGLQRCSTTRNMFCVMNTGCGGQTMIAEWYSFYSAIGESHQLSNIAEDMTFLSSSDVLGDFGASSSVGAVNRSPSSSGILSSAPSSPISMSSSVSSSGSSGPAQNRTTNVTTINGRTPPRRVKVVHVIKVKPAATTTTPILIPTTLVYETDERASATLPFILPSPNNIMVRADPSNANFANVGAAQPTPSPFPSLVLITSAVPNDVPQLSVMPVSPTSTTSTLTSSSSISASQSLPSPSPTGNVQKLNGEHIKISYGS